ncbi:MAG: DUF362 domain-containing protein [Promethearchaeota archaeon]
MRARVHIIKKKKDEIDVNFVLKALKQIEMHNFFSGTEKNILIKPNWVCDDLSSTGNVTSTDTLEGVVKYLVEDMEIPPSQIFLGDGGQGNSCQLTMKRNDVFRLKKYGLKLVDLNQDERVDDIKVKNPLALNSVNVAKTAWEADCIISIPSLKTHSMAGTTLSMKNLMGAILPKGIMHSRIHEKIADLTSLFRSKMKFQIIDGIIGSDGFEIGGSSIEMNIIIAGDDPVAVDRVGSAIIGRNPKYLKYAEEKGLGIANLDDIEVLGVSIEEAYQKFY